MNVRISSNVPHDVDKWRRYQSEHMARAPWDEKERVKLKHTYFTTTLFLRLSIIALAGMAIYLLLTK